VISKFFAGAREVEVDAVGDGTSVFIGSIIEHVENAGVHSGDATMSIPTLTISQQVKDRIRDYSRRIARNLRIRGPFNIQFLVKNQHVLVIECNLRASRSMPFVSKTIGVNLMDLAARAILGQKVEDTEGTPNSWCVKAPQFSFMRIDKADPVLGVEMVSTGEVACFGTSFDDAFVKAYIASNYYLPQPGDGVLVTMAKTRREILPYARMLADNGYRLFATRHTGEEFSENGIESRTLYKVSERKKPNIIDSIINKDVKLVINIPTSNGDITSQKILRDEYMIRRKATEYGIPVITNIELAKTIIESLTRRNGSRERAASGVLASQQRSVANSGPKNIEKITIPAT
jgi:carbamoyl-phosphate synthase large subunit